ncbi:TrmH family RNA methyltransferase [Candidatus Saccharibacteria bacterium CG10_big_fil_rev_8_21_14_0_10_47_8]|nr:MAG: TrmH family RNA methyltransferase [Candidatus Saccharibacteria bacterium CG10_big_fil_rev_8_21_14_0_10_47_8]
MKTRRVVLIAHDVRSCHNIGSLMRTAEGFGVKHLYLTGYSPYPEPPKDKRLPHIRAKLTRQIHKTALGAENTLDWSHETDITTVVTQLRSDGYTIAALEQTPDSVNLAVYDPPLKIALLVGNEINGLDQSVLDSCDVRLQIPMFGAKESFNVTVAAAIGLYHIQFAEGK